MQLFKTNQPQLGWIMSRPLRIEYKDAWYHVMNRGRRSESIFLTNRDYRRFLVVLKEATALWKVHICAYCLMPNHYHLLIQTPEANISRCMRHINGVYTQQFNRDHNTEGQLFRGRYKSILIGEKNYLMELLRYICFNPVKAGLVDHPTHYLWSSYNDYFSDSSGNEWLNADLILNRMLGIKNRQEAKVILFGSDASEDTYTFFSRKNQPSIIGSKEFIEETRNRFSKQVVHPEVPEAKVLEQDQLEKHHS